MKRAMGILKIIMLHNMLINLEPVNIISYAILETDL